MFNTSIFRLKGDVHGKITILSFILTLFSLMNFLENISKLLVQKFCLLISILVFDQIVLFQNLIFFIFQSH